MKLKYIYHYITHFNTYVVFSVAGMYQIFSDLFSADGDSYRE